jgi:hypothetical protein
LLALTGCCCLFSAVVLSELYDKTPGALGSRWQYKQYSQLQTSSSSSKEPKAAAAAAASMKGGLQNSSSSSGSSSIASTLNWLHLQQTP